jgi:cytochrome c oxidase subunit 2
VLLSGLSRSATRASQRSGCCKSVAREWASRRCRIIGLLGACLLTALVLVGCSQQTPNTFSNAGKGASDITTLTYALFGILGGILVVVWVWLFLAVVRGRKRPRSEASQVNHHRTAEIVWTVIPFAIVAVLFYLTLHTTGQIMGQKTGVNVTVTGHQWWWEFSYPQGGFKTADEAHIPLDPGTEFSVLSADVIHSFWCPRLSGKIDAIPGHDNLLRIDPLKTGVYPGLCAEFCGLEHNKMRFLIVVQSASDYAAWFANQEKPARAPVGAQAKAGARLIASLPCSSCHLIRGTSVQGTICPDLTHFGSRLTIGAGTLANTPANLRLWLKDPQQIKPGIIMPDFKLSPQQIDELAAYLEELK